VGRAIGPKKVHRYSAEFKLTAVKLSGMPGVQVQTAADALDIHPFMLSRWRKEARDGGLKGRAKRGAVASRPAREIKCLLAVIPLEACFLGWQDSLDLLTRLVEAEISD